MNLDQIKLGMVLSQFNQPITERLAKGAWQRLAELGITAEQVIYFEVPGAVEIPLMAKLIAEQRLCNAIVCLGAVIRGETNHYDYVCSQVSDGCQRVALDHGVPVIFGVLTTDNEEQALARTGGDQGHKGREAVDCAIMMLQNLQKLSTYLV